MKRKLNLAMERILKDLKQLLHLINKQMNLLLIVRQYPHINTGQADVNNFT